MASEIKTEQADTISTAPLPKAGKGRRRRRWMIPLAAVAVLAVVGGGIWAFTDRRGEGPVYTDYAVQRGTLRLTLEETSVLQALAERDVTSSVAGEVLTADLEIGAIVQAGDLLFTVDDSGARAALAQAELALDRAQQTLDQVRRQISHRTVTAPITGRVAAVTVREGDLLSPGMSALTLVDETALSLTLPFLAQDAAALAPGQGAQIVLEGTGEVLSGTVAQVSSGSYLSALGAQVSTVVLRVEGTGGISPGTAAAASVGEIPCHQPGTMDYLTVREVRSKVEGEVSGLTLIQGDRVQAGQTLFTLAGDGTDGALTAAQLAVEEARALADRRRQELIQYQIHAPVAGTVVSRTAHPGDKLTATSLGAPLAVIADLSRLRCPLAVDELDIAQVAPGQRVELTADAYPQAVYPGTVVSIDPMGAASGGVTTFTVWVEVADYGDLRPGMNLTAQIVTQQVQDVVSIPLAALEQGDQVWKKDPDGSYRAVSVRTGRTDGTLVEIVEGLDQGDIVGIVS